jgi:uncharacterized protein (UPF0210 family)
MHCCKINKLEKNKELKKQQGTTIVGGKVVVAPCHQMQSVVRKNKQEKNKNLLPGCNIKIGARV